MTSWTGSPCKCGQHEIPGWADAVAWYWQRHGREACTLELPNERCWCGLLRSEHIKGHADTQDKPTAEQAGNHKGQ